MKKGLFQETQEIPLQLISYFNLNTLLESGIIVDRLSLSLPLQKSQCANYQTVSCLYVTIVRFVFIFTHFILRSILDTQS